jgi:hypothetical protein
MVGWLDDVQGEVGADETISGDDEIGAAPVQVRQKKALPPKRQPLPLLAAIDIAAGADFEMSAAPQDLFRAEAMVLTGDTTDFVIEDIKCGNMSQLVESGELSADLFPPDAINTYIKFDTVGIGGKVIVRVRNTHATDQKSLRGVLFGTVIQKR